MGRAVQPVGACGAECAPVGCAVQPANPGAGVARSATRGATRSATPRLNVGVGSIFRPVLIEEPGQGHLQGSRGEDVGVDAYVGITGLDAAQGSVAEVRDLGEGLLSLVSPVAETADVAADPHALAIEVTGGWIFGHIGNAGGGATCRPGQIWPLFRS